MHKFCFLGTFILLQAFALFYHTFANPDVNPVTDIPIPVQAELVLYVLSQEKSIRQNTHDDLIVGLVSQNDTDTFVREITDEFEKLCAMGIEGRKCITRNYFLTDFHEMDFLVEIAAQDGVKALYFADFPDPEKLAAVSETANRHNIISIGRKIDWVQGGLTYGVFMRNNIPQIYVNSDSLRNADFIFDAGLLRLGEFLR